MSTILTSMCVVWDRNNDQTLLIDRQHGKWKGYAPPGGHVDPAEGITECTIREVYEETGLIIYNPVYKGLVYFTHSTREERYLVFCYLAQEYTGEISASTEGAPEWVPLSQVPQMRLAPGLQERWELFFDPGVREMRVIWDESGRLETTWYRI